MYIEESFNNPSEVRSGLEDRLPLNHMSPIISKLSGNGIGCKEFYMFNPHKGCHYACSYCYNLKNGKNFRNIETFDSTSVLLQLRECLQTLEKETSFYFGQFQDALGIDHITEITKKLIPLFAAQKFARLVMVTKSDYIKNLLEVDPKGHTAIVWSLNPQPIIDAYEGNTPEVDKRLEAARQCREAEYIIRFQISPIIPVSNWKPMYKDLIHGALRQVTPQRITIAGLSCFPTVLEKLKSGNKHEKYAAFLFKNQPIDNDGRIRLPEELRIEIYRYILHNIQRINPSIDVSLCLETREVHEIVGTSTNMKCNCIW